MLRCFYCGGDHRSSSCPFELQRQGNNAFQQAAYRQLEATNELISIQYESRVDLNNINKGVASVTEATDNLAEIFQLAHSEAMWMAEKQIQLLTGISDMLKNPRATLADELLKMGVNSLRVDMIEESIKLLKEAQEKNPLDYRIYVALGHAYLKKDDYKNALNCFEYALKNGRTEKYKCFALLLVAQVKYCINQIDDAIQASKMASEICPNFPEALYRYAIYMTAKISSSKHEDRK